jgi:hypothetical protein
MLQMYGPCADSVMIRGRPSICSEVEMAGVITEQLANVIVGFLKARLYIASHRVWRRYFELGPASCQEFSELSIGENLDGSVVFSDPFDDVSVCLSGGMGTMGHLNWLLALASEGGENRPACLLFRQCSFAGIAHGILTPALDSVVPEVGCGCTIAFV